MSQLKDLQVDWISLVDKAAVRDPGNQSEPRRFILWKSEGGAIDKKETTQMELTGSASETELSPSVQRALDDALATLEPHAPHPTIGGLLGKLKGAGARSEPGEGAVEKAMLSLRMDRVNLAKSEYRDPQLLAQIDKADRELQLEYLCKHSGAFTPERRAARERIIRQEGGGARLAA